MQKMQETHFQSLGQEDPSQKGMATHSSILDRGALAGYSPRGHRVRQDWVTEHIHIYMQER